MDYAIIRVGNKQHRVRDGETLVVDRIHTDEGKSFTPDVLLGDSGVEVTAKVVAHERGPKIVIGKYRRRTGYKRHTGFRAATSRIEISLGGAKNAAAPEKAEPEAKPPVRASGPVEGVRGNREVPPMSDAEPPKAETHEHVKGMPKGYEEMTVADVSEGAKTWNRPMLEAALEYEQANAKRKGAISALEHAITAKEEG
jgi:large subunit ribosomal protein L21